MRRLAVALLLAAPAALACTEQGCSDDPVPVGAAGVLGDEVLCWDEALDPNGDPVTYEVWSSTRTDGPCLVTGQTSVVLSGTSCLAGTDTARVRVRACDDQPACGGWSDVVEFLPHACLRDGCEERCHDGASRRLPHLPECGP